MNSKVSDKKIKMLLFDLGNVILPFKHSIIVKRLGKIDSFNEKKANEYIFKTGLARSYEKGEISSYEFFRRLKKRFNLHLSFNVFKPVWEDIFSSNNDMAGLLRILKRKKYRLCLLSNTNDLHFNYVRNKFKILSIFDKYYLSYKMHMVKPQPEIYLKVLKSEKIKPEECVYIDDIEEYVRVAKKIGIIGIQYRYFRQFKSEIEACGIPLCQ